MCAVCFSFSGWTNPPGYGAWYLEPGKNIWFLIYSMAAMLSDSDGKTTEAMDLVYDNGSLSSPDEEDSTNW